MQYHWIILSDCEDDKQCKKNYPNFPICDIDESFKCISNSDDLQAENVSFDINDVCKYYGEIYVFDVEVNACRVPKCSIEKDYCPKPSKCWRGKSKPYKQKKFYSSVSHLRNGLVN